MGGPAMISFPIADRVTVTATHTPHDQEFAHVESQGVKVNELKISVQQQQKSKVLQALKAARFTGLRLPESGLLSFDISTPAPVGKGMATSSAEITACIKAAAAFSSMQVSQAQIASWAAAVEPTDPVMYERPVLFDYMSGQLLDQQNFLPLKLVAVTFDEGGIYDTPLGQRPPLTPKQQRASSEALELTWQGLCQNDLSAVASGASLSTSLRQLTTQFAHFDVTRDLSSNNGALGVSCAHTGTLLSAIFAPDQLSQVKDLQNEAIERGLTVKTRHITL